MAHTSGRSRQLEASRPPDLSTEMNDLPDIGDQYSTACCLLAHLADRLDNATMGQELNRTISFMTELHKPSCC